MQPLLTAESRSPGHEIPFQGVPEGQEESGMLSDPCRRAHEQTSLPNSWEVLEQTAGLNDSDG